MYVKALVQIKKFRIFKAFLKYAYPSCWYDNVAKHKWNILPVRSECDNMKPKFEEKVENGWHLHIYTERAGKQIPFQKKNRRRAELRELNIFTLIIVWHLWIHVCSDRHTQTSPVGDLRSELGIVLAKIQLESKQNGSIPNEKTVNTNGIEWTVCVLVVENTDRHNNDGPTPQRGGSPDAVSNPSFMG